MSNAVAIGLTRRSVLPFEDLAEYRSLVDALFEEHCPEGLTEQHLVEEIAGVLWRKRRLCMAEAALYRRGILGTMGEYGHTVAAALTEPDREDEDGDTDGHAYWLPDAVHATDAETEDGLAGAEEAAKSLEKALARLDSEKPSAYQAAIDALRIDLKEGWEWEVENDPKKPPAERVGYQADAAGLRKFLETTVGKWNQTQLKEFRGRGLIREQVFGEALNSLRELEEQEAHLDRKLERTIATLSRLQELRMSGGW
jgi:hypothetical protein